MVIVMVRKFDVLPSRMHLPEANDLISVISHPALIGHTSVALKTFETGQFSDGKQ